MPEQISCEPSELVKNATCIFECVPPGMQLPVLISIFCQLADMDCTPASLMTSAVCQLQCIPAGMQMPVLISLACQILNLPAPESCSQWFSGNGDPTGVITPTCDTAAYVQKDSNPIGQVWTWWNGSWH